MELLYVGETDDLYVCNNEHVKRQEFLSKLPVRDKKDIAVAIGSEKNIQGKRLLRDWQHQK